MNFETCGRCCVYGKFRENVIAYKNEQVWRHEDKETCLVPRKQLGGDVNETFESIMFVTNRKTCCTRDGCYVK